MSAFEAAVPVLLAHEGGYVDDPEDPGGETNWGISRLIIGAHGITAAELSLPDLLPGRLALMPRAAAVEAYRRHFWACLDLARIEHQGSATKLLDAAVNLVGNAAVRCAQRAVGVGVDGLLGPRTVGRINDAGASFEGLMAGALELHYRVLAHERPSLAKFLPTWLLRAGCLSHARCRLHPR